MAGIRPLNGDSSANLFKRWTNLTQAAEAFRHTVEEAGKVVGVLIDGCLDSNEWRWTYANRCYAKASRNGGPAHSREATLMNGAILTSFRVVRTPFRCNRQLVFSLTGYRSRPPMSRETTCSGVFGCRSCCI